MPGVRCGASWIGRHRSTWRRGDQYIKFLCQVISALQASTASSRIGPVGYESGLVDGDDEIHVPFPHADAEPR